MIKTHTGLMPHQQDAYEKMVKLKVGALYMGMGTGKTRTAIELIKKRVEKGKVDSVLWFCPCSVKTNLRIDIEKHTDGLLPKIKIMGIESISMSDRAYMECLEYIQNRKVFLIVDESNLVKNPLALRTKRMIALSEILEYKLILNGTPVTKNEADLYAQWCILDRRIFGYRTFWSFAANHLEYDEYGRVRRVLNVDYLTNKIAPYSFQISKEECLDLPKKMHYYHWFDLDGEQRSHYGRILEEMTAEVREEDESTIYRLLTALQLVTSGRRVTWHPKITSEAMFTDPANNPRIDALDYLIRKIGKEKVIVWCKYHFEMEEVKALLNSQNLKYREFHGGIPLRKRHRSIQDFEKERDVQFLIGNKAAGGYGLNLQFCRNMIYYSNDFNWGTTAQSEDRIHRIGQTQECNYYHIFADIGIDRMIDNNLARKENLDISIRTMLKKKNWKEVLQ